MISLHKKAMIALTMMAVAVGPAFAEDPAPPQNHAPSMSGPHGMMGHMMGGNGSAEAMCGAMTRHIEGHLAYIKAELQVTDAQEPLWNAYAAAARDNAKIMIARCTTIMGSHDAQTSLPDRLDQKEQLMTAHLDAVRAMDKALKPLYAALDETQKKAADQLFWGASGMM